LSEEDFGPLLDPRLFRNSEEMKAGVRHLIVDGPYTGKTLSAAEVAKRMRELEKRYPALFRAMAMASVSAWLAPGDTMPRRSDLNSFRALLYVCRVPKSNVESWIEALMRFGEVVPPRSGREWSPGDQMGTGVPESESVFLCHSSGDKEQVRNLYRRLTSDSVRCWFDEENLVPGQDWDREMQRALRDSRFVLACLSNASITKSGYIQKELRSALDVADEQPEGSIFLIPVRLEECEIPERLRRWQHVDLFKFDGYERILRALRYQGSAKLEDLE
jgi:TIR domain